MSDPAQPTQVATIVPAASVTAVIANVARDAPASRLYGTNFNPDPTKDTVVLSSGAATVSAATTTQLDLAFTTPPNTGSLDATVIAYGGASSPTLFAYFASAAGNNATSCMVTDLRTSVNATTCVAASTTVTSPAGIAVGGGYAYVASSTSGAVSACTISNGTFVGCSTTNVATAGGAQLSAVALNPSGNVLYATDKANAAVVQCSVSGTSITGCSVAASGAPLSQPKAVAIESQTAYIADATIDNGLIVCGINGASLGCSRANLTAASQPTALAYYANPGGTVKRLYMLNNGTNSWAACDLAASRTLGYCSSAPTNAYPSGGTPTGIAALPTLAGYNSPTLLVSFGAAANENCDTATATCTAMPFGYSSAVAVG